MLIDQYLPSYDYNAIYKVKVNAPPKQVYQAIKELKPKELSPLVFTMLNLRELPAKIIGKAPSNGFGDQPFLDQLFDGDFLLLEEKKGSEFVFGLLGQFWKLTGGEELPFPVRDGQNFIEFDHSEFAKVAANFAVVWDESKGITTLITETRILTPNPRIRRKFAFYWRIISLGSGWIRVLWLRAIKRKAEAMK